MTLIIIKYSLPEWKVDLEGTFLGNADGCLEVLDADVKLFRFTILLFQIS